jgi:hypothetical protein
VVHALTSEHVDCVVIGAGLRLPPDHLVLVEAILNVVHRRARERAHRFQRQSR